MSLNFIECCDYIASRFELRNYYSVDETHTWIKRLCLHNSILLGELQVACCNVMMKKTIKKITLFFVGQSNAGKSVLMRSLRDGFCEFGLMTKSDTFAFQDCIDRQVVVNEEMLVDPKNVDRFKQLAEGSDVKVDVKMKEPVIVRRTPIIVCSNTNPWHWVPAEKSALLNRMYLFRLKPFDDLKNCVKDLDPMYWRETFNAFETGSHGNFNAYGSPVKKSEGIEFVAPMEVSTQTIQIITGEEEGVEPEVVEFEVGEQEDVGTVSVEAASEIQEAVAAFGLAAFFPVLDKDVNQFLLWSLSRMPL